MKILTSLIYFGLRSDGGCRLCPLLLVNNLAFRDGPFLNILHFLEGKSFASALIFLVSLGPNMQKGAVTVSVEPNTHPTAQKDPLQIILSANLAAYAIFVYRKQRRTRTKLFLAYCIACTMQCPKYSEYIVQWFWVSVFLEVFGVPCTLHCIVLHNALHCTALHSTAGHTCLCG